MCPEASLESIATYAISEYTTGFRAAIASCPSLIATTTALSTFIASEF